MPSTTTHFLSSRAPILVAVEILAPSNDAFLAALRSAAMAIGLGMQDLIKTLVGGLVVVTDRSFQTGYPIKMAEACGEVKQIGLRSATVQMSNGISL